MADSERGADRADGAAADRGMWTEEAPSGARSC